MFGPGNQYRFPPGKSGNPGGANKIAREVRELAEADTPEAYLIVAEMMRTAEKDSTRLAAAIAVLKMAGVPMNAQINVTVNHQQQSEAAQAAPTPHLEDGLGPSGAQA